MNNNNDNDNYVKDFSPEVQEILNGLNNSSGNKDDSYSEMSVSGIKGPEMQTAASPEAIRNLSNPNADTGTNTSSYNSDGNHGGSQYGPNGSGSGSSSSSLMDDNDDDLDINSYFSNVNSQRPPMNSQPFGGTPQQTGPTPQAPQRGSTPYTPPGVNAQPQPSSAPATHMQTRPTTSHPKKKSDNAPIKKIIGIGFGIILAIIIIVAIINAGSSSSPTTNTATVTSSNTAITSETITSNENRLYNPTINVTTDSYYDTISINKYLSVKNGTVTCYIHGIGTSTKSDIHVAVSITDYNKYTNGTSIKVSFNLMKIDGITYAVNAKIMS
jgi:hypothetical protein